MKLGEMKVETPTPLREVEDRSLYVGSENLSQCSYCGTREGDPWYPVDDVTVIRHWTKSGGIGWWYCPEHLSQWTGRWWRNSDLAPAHLLPELKHRCERGGALGSKCGDDAAVAISGIWTCDRHAEAARVQRRIEDLLADDDTSSEDPRR